MRHNLQWPAAPAALVAFLAADLQHLSAQNDSSSRAKPGSADVLDADTYVGWQQYRLLCDRCHGEEARGTSFGPDLMPAFKDGGTIGSAATFKTFITAGRPDKGMPPASQLGLSPEHFDGIYRYLHGRSNGKYVGGRPVRKG
jgi:hypothetical protein